MQRRAYEIVQWNNFINNSRLGLLLILLRDGDPVECAECPLRSSKSCGNALRLAGRSTSSSSDDSSLLGDDDLRLPLEEGCAESAAVVFAECRLP